LAISAAVPSASGSEQKPDATSTQRQEQPVAEASGGANRRTIPKKRQRHHSFDESANEPASLIPDEATDIEAERPVEEDEPVEEALRREPVIPPAFEEEGPGNGN
jgi:hypothetical protein